MATIDEYLDSAEEAIARAAVHALVDGPVLTRFLEEPRGNLPVGILEEEVRVWLGSETRLVHLPEQIMHKQRGRWTQKRKGGDLQYRGHHLWISEYRLLPRLIEQPQLVMRYMPGRRIPEAKLALRLNLLSEVNRRYYNIVIGRIPDNARRIGLISFHRMDDGRLHVERMIAQAETGERGQEVFRNSLRSRKRDGTAPGSPVGPPGGLQNSAARP